MYQSKRARRGSATTKSPYEQLKQWIGENLIGIFFIVVMCFLWCGLLLLFSQLTVFFGGRYFLKFWDEEEGGINAFYIYSRPWMELIRICGFVFIVVYMFRRLRKKR